MPPRFIRRIPAQVDMKLIATTMLSLCVFTTAFVEAQPSRDAAPTQTISIQRSGTQQRQQGAAGQYRGGVRIDPLFQAPAPARSFGADQLRSHLARARANGVTREELIETITHLAFYSGWPNAVAAVTVAREMLGKE